VLISFCIFHYGVSSVSSIPHYFLQTLGHDYNCAPYKSIFEGWREGEREKGREGEREGERKRERGEKGGQKGRRENGREKVEGEEEETKSCERVKREKRSHVRE